MNLANMRIGVRLSLGFGALLLLLSFMTALAIIKMSTLNDGTEYLVKHEWVEAKYANTALDNVRGSIARVFEMVSAADDQARAPALQRLQANTAAFDDALAKLEPMLLSGEAMEKVKKAKDARMRYVTSYGKVLELLKSGNKDDATKLAYGETYTELHTFADTLREMITLLEQHFDDSGARSVKTFESTRMQMLALGAVALAMGLIFAYLITRSITVPVSEALHIAQTVAAGDLSSNIESDAKDETGQLLRALREMNDSLVKIVGEVRAGTETMASATAEIATGNMDLSSRTESQAGALEETASSMEELTGTVRQNADNARQANQLAMSASDVALKGGAVVADVVNTMGSINDSSKKIVDIIGVIDGIAFQTNILALNAAVEAARAGEQGRGFAVVAAEVRNLAQRSAGAAKEIKSLIGDSVAKVEEGSRLVDQAGVTMNEIVDSIRRVTDIMGEITAASSEQTSGIEQINVAIVQMDDTTQQNAALVEEAAAAAGSLEDQANHLSKLVSVFKVDSAHMAAARQAISASMTSRPKVGTLAHRGKVVSARIAKLTPPPPRRLARSSQAGDDWEQF